MEEDAAWIAKCPCQSSRFVYDEGDSKKETTRSLANRRKKKKGAENGMQEREDRGFLPDAAGDLEL